MSVKIERPDLVVPAHSVRAEAGNAAFGHDQGGAWLRASRYPQVD